ncbi:PREDICTED: pickpocket protein 19-like [Dinoponera quadriceps]|uniref:Pickpocket protein 19-like n=1 Tax=Dinoponera quadriceps TaxID=609295 RepID=A0A6P3XX15_DINQU|nr:PREDICTED: pickpocket protein 19-like [Dinoponera quadriceps]
MLVTVVMSDYPVKQITSHLSMLAVETLANTLQYGIDFGNVAEIDIALSPKRFHLRVHTIRSNEGLSSRADINVTEVLYEAMPRCDEFMSGCWWRNGNRNCCEIFEVQRTEYGFCYSFNSEVAEPSWNTHGGRHPESRPRRASGYGEWSGLKVTIHLGNITKPPDSVEIGGIVVLINEPHVWPNSGTMIPSGSLVSLSVDCVSGFATQGVLKLDESRTPCKYDATGEYNQETCLSQCKRTYVIKHCGCNPSFFFPLTPERDCNAVDLVCLANFNVSFGGIIGLFLGGSLLSVIELLYYLMVAAFSSLYSRHRTRAGSKTLTNAPIVRTTVLPILDYSPLKPPARKIPIFANYGTKSNLNRY